MAGPSTPIFAANSCAFCASDSTSISTSRSSGCFLVTPTRRGKPSLHGLHQEAPKVMSSEAITGVRRMPSRVSTLRPARSQPPNEGAALPTLAAPLSGSLTVATGAEAKRTASTSSMCLLPDLEGALERVPHGSFHRSRRHLLPGRSARALAIAGMDAAHQRHVALAGAVVRAVLRYQANRHLAPLAQAAFRAVFARLDHQLGRVGDVFPLGADVVVGPQAQVLDGVDGVVAQVRVAGRLEDHAHHPARA